MNKETRRAVKLSITKWKVLAENGYTFNSKKYREFIRAYDNYLCDCPLCEIYANASVARYCFKCSLNEYAFTSCHNPESYYRKWYNSRTKKAAMKYAQKIVEALEECLK